MTRYWIYDKDTSKTGFPVGTLLELLDNVFGSRVLRIMVHRAEGYGEKISSWDGLLFDSNDKVEVTINEIINAVNNDDEVFYWLDIEFNLDDASRITFGIHDSSSMYVESVDDISELLGRKFARVIIGKINE